MAALGVITGAVKIRKGGKTLSVWAATNAGAVPNGKPKLFGVRVVQWWRHNDRLSLAGKAETGRIEGVITTNGVVTPNSVVSLFYSPTGEILAKVKTDANGVYKFGKNGLRPVALDPLDGAVYTVVAEHPTAERNAKITDRITPGV